MGTKKGSNVKNPQFKKKGEAARSGDPAYGTVEHRLNGLSNITNVIHCMIEAAPDENMVLAK